MDAKHVFDYHDFLNRVMGDEELAKCILQEFMSVVDEHTDKLRLAVDSQDHEAVRQISHMIKGESGNISASSLYECAYEIEKSAKNRDGQQEQQLLPALLDAVETLKKNVGKLLD